MDVLYDAPRYRYAIVCARTPAELVKQHKRAGREIVEYARCFGHLDHECALAERDVVRGSHTGEYLVDIAYMCALGWYERPYLCHQGDEGGLSEQRALACHVGSCDDDDLLV